jgi:hypothetical protein
VASLRRQDKDVTGADYNLSADDPPLWVRTVRQALAGIGEDMIQEERLGTPRRCRVLG